jgi:CheY-like chemotaxis protein
MALRCLLVDDDARFVHAARALLEGEGMAIDTASTGAEAIRRISERAPDLVLLDICLGSDSGFEVARRIHAAWLSRSQDSSHGSPRIILISTYSEADFGHLIRASPVLGFIAKASLSARAIRELLERGPSGP